MKKITCFLFFFYSSFYFGQTLSIEWQKTLGGTNADVAKSVIQHNDSYIITGFSNSPISGDKTVFNGLSSYNDIWAISLDNSSAFQWQKAYAHSLVSDNGLHSSNVSFNFFDSKFHLGLTNLEWDVFISRVHYFDENGLNASYFSPGEDLNCTVIQYSTSYEMTMVDYFKTLNDHYFYSGTKLFFAFSCNNLFPTKGYFLSLSTSTDYNSVIWRRNFSGNNYDELTSAIETNDGGFLLSGFSNSNIGEDKTENSLGGHDFWIIKTDSNGNIVWQNTIGGNATDQPIKVIQTNDNGYLIAGYSNSTISSDKTENSKGGYDYWLVKIDSLGNVLWDKTIGGNLDDKLSKIITTSDGNFLLIGNSKSSISGDKNQENRGENDAWIIKINPSGTILWQKTIGGNLDDYAYDVIQTTDSGFLIVCSSKSSISGDKSENSRGDSDYWIIKLEPDSLTHNETELLNQISVYPNPTNNIITINYDPSLEKASISIYNVLGQLINKTQLDQITENRVPIEGQNGVYFIQIETKNHQKRVFKIIKN